MSPRSSGLFLSALACLGLGFWLASSQDCRAGLVWLVPWFVAVLALEWSARPLPGVGAAGSSYFLLLVAPQVPLLGFAGAASVLPFAFLGRVLARPAGRAWPLRLQEGLVAVLAPTVGLATAKVLAQHGGYGRLLPFVVGAAVFLPLHLSRLRDLATLASAKSRSAHALALEQITPFVVCGAALSCWGASLPVSFAILLAIVLQIAMGSAVAVAKARAEVLLERELSKSQRELSQTGQKLSQTEHAYRQSRKDVAVSMAEQESLRKTLSLLDLFLAASVELSRLPQEASMLERVARFARQVVSCEAAGWSRQEQHIVSGCAPELLDGGALRRLQDEIRRDSRPILSFDPGGSGLAPLAGTRSLLAIPLRLPEGSVLWAASKRERAFGEESLDRLSLFAVLVGQACEGGELQRRLAHSLKLASIGQLAAGMAHEINNPLAALRLGLQSAEHWLASDPEKARARLQAAEAPLQRIQELVADLLATSREQASALSLAPFDLVEAVNEVLEETSPQLQDLQLTWAPPPAAPALGDKRAVKQVVVNLLLNACDAVKLPGAQGLRVALLLEQAADRVLLRVRDSGPGVAPEVVGSIFDPFFTTKPPGRGTGLGLFVSLELSRAMGGQLELEQNSTRGCCFRLSLPCRPHNEREARG